MPWNVPDLMSQRLEFVLLARQEGVNLKELCRRFGISLKTGWKWRRRFKDRGFAGLTDRSRRPHASPRRCDEKTEAVVIALRREHPTWGGRKLHDHLVYRGGTNVPSPSTCTEILRRAKLLDPERTPTGPLQRFERGYPNELWQLDYKGHIATQSGQRCHPLTALDDCSRFNLVLSARPDERARTVQGDLTTAFELYGLPDGLLCDNGPPWGCSDPTCPYTSLTVWLLRLGIRVLHGRPYHPQTQGKEERFHRTLNEDLLSQHTWRDLAHCQALFTHYREVYNCERPHQQLGGVPPITRYRPSVRSLPDTLPSIEYPSGSDVRCLRTTGLLTFGGQTWYVGRPFGGLPIGLRPSASTDGRWVVLFGRHRLGLIDLTAPAAPKHQARSIYDTPIETSDLLPIERGGCPPPLHPLR